MELLNIQDYCNKKKAQLKILSRDKFIKLGIIDLTDKSNKGSQSYIKSIIKDFNDINWEYEIFTLSKEIDNARDLIYQALKHGCTSILVPTPIAEGVKFDPDYIPSYSDCDGQSSSPTVIPATALGIMQYLNDCKIEVNTAVVIGRSKRVGEPVAKLLLNKDITVTICHSKTKEKDLQYLVKNADLIVSATGVPNLLHRFECPNSIVIDAGISLDENGQIVGDFLEDQTKYKKGQMSTPVPGGVGLLTRIGLMQNCYIQGQEYQYKIKGWDKYD